MSSDELADPERLVSLDAVASLLEESAEATRCPDFGLRLSGEQKPEVLGPLAVVLMNSLTLRQAVVDVSRFLSLHSPGYRLTLDSTSPLLPDCASVRLEIGLGSDRPLRQLVDGCLGDMWRWARLLTSRQFDLAAVSLPHTPLAAPDAYRRFFGAPVYFGQPYAGLHVSPAVLEADLRPTAPLVRQSAIAFIAKIAAPRSRSTAERVEDMLVVTMGSSSSSRSAVADLLGMHPRTLQRRLQDEGLTFAAVRERVYQRTALRLLRETEHPISQVAAVLGYSEQAAFTRACQRWFGNSPSSIRALAGGGLLEKSAGVLDRSEARR